MTVLSCGQGQEVELDGEPAGRRLSAEGDVGQRSVSRRTTVLRTLPSLTRTGIRSQWRSVPAGPQAELSGPPS